MDSAPSFFKPWQPHTTLSRPTVSSRTVPLKSSGPPYSAALSDEEPRLKRALENSLVDVCFSFDEQIELAKTYSLK